jgi:bloom syndrome protein
VTHKSGPKTLNDIIALIKSKFNRSSGIIYCLSRKDCDSTAEKLKLSNIKAVSYHAGMSDKKREEVQRDWITDKFRVVVATTAFGMGIVSVCDPLFDAEVNRGILSGIGTCWS